MQANKSIQFGSTIIFYTVSFSQRKTAAIEVHPDQQVTIKAPVGSEPATIETLIRRRAPWILRQQRQFSTYAPYDEVPRSYTSGESYRYLGRQYRLKVLEGEPKGVKQERSFLYIAVADKNDAQQVQQILDQWYRDKAKQVFHERLRACYPRVERLGIAYPALAIRTMKTRWGSCTQSGLITLNPKLIQTPKSCIDYVLIHELCHLKEHNHGKHYYQLLGQALPNWREYRQKLNQFEFC
jgi:predicted metal-dependent hydrolase